MKLIKHAVLTLFILFSSQALAEPVAGKDYKLISPAQATSSGNKIEVLEFFFYGCPSCFNLHQELAPWERKIPKDVELVSVPAIFNPNWEPMAYTFYALEILGKQRDLHPELYKAWHVNNINLLDESKIADFVSKHGVDSKKFSDAYRSFGMQSKIMRSKQLAQAYNIRGTPTLIVDGRYLITGLQPAETIKVLNALIEKTRKERTNKR